MIVFLIQYDCLRSNLFQYPFCYSLCYKFIDTVNSPCSQKEENVIFYNSTEVITCLHRCKMLYREITDFITGRAPIASLAGLQLQGL